MSPPHFRQLPRKALEDAYFKDMELREKSGRKRPEVSPLSGSELKWDPKHWNEPDYILENHNCYSYATGTWSKKRKGKAQPGYSSGDMGVPDEGYQCLNFLNRLRRDNPSLILSNFDAQCPKGFHKAFMALSNEGSGIDYHFYRQDNNKLWSHKPGRTEATNLDASGKLIKDPLYANRKYATLNYKVPCFYFCVAPGLSQTSSVTLPNKVYRSKQKQNKQK